MADNAELQNEELEVLRSVYEDQWKHEDFSNRNFSIEIVEGSWYVTLYLNLPPDYPLQAPPIYEISAPSLSRNDKREISNRLELQYLENIGESVIYQWIESIRSFLQKKSDDETTVLISQEKELENLSLLDCVQQISVSKENPICKVPEMTHGECILDRKSIFQGHVAIVKSTQEVESVVLKLKENKKIANATHNIFAYRIKQEKKGATCIIQDCEDDGETQAGSRLLHLLQIMDICNVLVVVSRWYGGVHLGPDRFRHINNAARKTLVAAGFTTTKK